MPRFIDIDGTLSSEAAVTARSAINILQISVLDYISDPSDTASHQAGFEAAIAAAVAGDGYEIVIPAGDWYVEGLVIPKKAPLKFRGHGSANYAQRSESTVGVTLGSRLVRTGDIPVIIGIGGEPPTVTTTITDNNVAEVEWTDLVRDVVFEDLTFENQCDTATTPLIDLRGAGGIRFNRVVFFSETQTSNMIELTATMDSSFSHCYVLGGSVSLRINDGSDTYWASNAVWFNSCDFENYGETAIDIGDSTSSHAQAPRLIRFSDQKIEGPTTSGDNAAIILQRGNGFYFDQAYVGHFNVTGPIMDVRKVNGLYGDIGFIRQYNVGYVDPSARIEFTADSHFVDLDVYVHTGPGSSVNVITQADTGDQTINYRINGLSKKVNNSTQPNRYDDVSTVWQRSSAATCQYVFDRTGVNRWSVGNPTNPFGDQQAFSISASDSLGNTSQIMRLLSYNHTSGSDPATATYRDMNLSAFLNLSSTKLGWVNFQNLVSPPAAPVGGLRLYAASGRLTVDGTNLALATDLTGYVSSGGALGTPSSGTLTNCTGLPVAGITASTSTALGVGSLELGHASDTTLSRSAAGMVAVEGVNVTTEIDVPHDLASGESTMARQHINATTLAPGNGNLRLTYFTARRSFTAASIRTTCNVAQVGATLARIGLYTVDGSGNLTLVASTTNDTNLWIATGASTKSLSSSYAVVRGQRYALGVLVVGTSTSPQLSGNGTVSSAECAVAPRLCGFVGSQTDLPASVSSGSVSDTFHQYYAALVP